MSTKTPSSAAGSPAKKRSSLQREIARREAVERALSESKGRQRQFRRLARQALTRQERERLKLSRRLQEEIAQTLAGINFHLAAIQTQIPAADPAVKIRIRKAKQLVEKSVGSVQRFARDLRPTLLDDLGLVPALRTYVQAFGKRAGLRVHFTACAEVEDLTKARRTALYRVAQASLAQICPQARGGAAAVKLERSPDEVCLRISDGCATALVSKVKRPTDITGMRERAEMVGGTFRLEFTPGEGTTIETCMPVRRRVGRVALNTPSV